MKRWIFVPLLFMASICHGGFTTDNLKATATMMIPNSATPPTADCNENSERGRIYIDTNATSGQQFYACEGTGGWVQQGGSGSGGGMSPGATYYIQASDTLQDGATAYPSYIYVGSSMTVEGPFSVDYPEGEGAGGAKFTLDSSADNPVVAIKTYSLSASGMGYDFIDRSNWLHSSLSFPPSSTLTVETALRIASTTANTALTRLGIKRNGVIKLYNESGTALMDIHTATADVNVPLRLTAQKDLRLADSDSSNYVAFKSPATVGSNVTWTLPNADASGCFQSDGAGVVSIASCGSGAGDAVLAATQTFTGANTFRSTVTIRGALVTSTSPVVNANYTATGNDTIILGSATVSGPITITLPLASNNGQHLWIKKIDGSTNPVRVVTSNSDVIEGTNTVHLFTQYEGIHLYSAGGSTWVTPEGFPAASIMANLGPGNAAAAVGTASSSYQSVIHLDRYATAYGIAVQIGANSGRMDVGIYDGRTGGRLASAGATTPGGTGKQIINFSSQVHLRPGPYYLALAADNATISFTRCGSQSSVGTTVLANNMPLGATINPVDPGNQTGQIPCMTLMVNGGITE